jgi:uncharacterized protein involved in exopolysaccharide biosynthesis
MVESSDRPAPAVSGSSEPSVAELREQLDRVEHQIQEVRREVTHRHGPTLAEGPASAPG